ncbi:guanylate-binding protein 2-like [Ptychodera flava]|uniref:guanylate-binding protein 2-like n=1 Tax=Ptychodera flava TaxID=63121 RepID=UPI00396A005F
MTTTNIKPKCVPLCYPDNYKWDKSKGNLIRTEKTRGQLVVCEDALEIIRSIDGPICPVAVTGPARSGKSYIASKLIEPRPQDCVFKISETQNPETTGIWMSTKTFKRKLSHGREVTVIILDTEGLDAHNAHKGDDMLMFALMALMSSVLVYNSKDSVRAEDLNTLSWVNRLVEVFKWSGCSPKKTSPLENEFIKFFPNFFWLLRDVTKSFQISQDGENVKVDFKYYLLEEILKLEKEDGTTTAKVKELNATRRALLKSFPVFDAMTLPMPSIEESVLEELDKEKNRGRINTTFFPNIDIFINRCRTLMKPKKAWPYDGNINGNQFAKMLQQYVSRFSETKIINVDDVVQSVIEAQLQQVVDLVFTDYRDDMDEYANAAIPCQNYEITKKHNDCMHQAMRKFKENAKCINDAKSLNKYRDVLKKKIVQYSDGDVVGGYLRIILDKNEKMSDDFCTQLVDELLLEISEPGKIYSRQLSSGSNVDFLNEQYKERARGPQMWHVYKTVLADKIEDISPRGMKECASSDDDVNSVMSVSARAAEIEKMEKEKTKEQIFAMKKEEDKTIQAMMVEDIDDQQKQLETDFEERSAAIQAQIETLRRTHQGLVEELQHGLDNMRVEKKVKQEELTRKQDEVMRQS